ncbi:MAG: hypothetical protein PHD97_00370 [Bacteroidales bacterium]|nr:hypothetical protein [Bacteroidales bacterium]
MSKQKKPKTKVKKIENFEEIQGRGKRLEVLINLSNDIREKENRLPILFNDFLYLVADQPELALRNIFQLFHDMVHYFVPEGKDEYEVSNDSIGFVRYDFSKMFVRDCDDPFFADRLFANRFMNLAKSFKKGIQNNHIYLFEGPPGSGKSTFLNNLLLQLEAYTKTPEGFMFETYWRLDVDKISNFQEFQNQINIFGKEESGKSNLKQSSEEYLKTTHPKKFLDVPCPSHDHPILQIPKAFRKNFLDELISDEKFKHKIFNDKEYEWILKDSPCHICSSIYNNLINKVGDPLEIFNMINARRMDFSRQFGSGVSVYNPGDEVMKKPITNPTLQKNINELFKNDEIKYIHSYLASTNNGVHTIMDIKEHNVERLIDLHGIISDGVHKVELVEERIKTLFVGLINPEDKRHYENVKSFQDRVITVCIPYILDYNTEVAIYKNKFSESVTSKFLPRVLSNFAKIIISTRLNLDSPAINRWIQDSEKYRKYIDRNLMLLKMDIYTGKIPTWLSEEDIKTFDRQTRKEIIADSENEGAHGISGRQSLNVFNSFISKYTKTGKPVTMEMVKSFFLQDSEKLVEYIPEGFIQSLEDLYDFNVLQEVKESMYFFNETQISNDIQDYLFAINYEPGEKVKCTNTGHLIEISDNFFKNFEAMFLGTTSSEEQRIQFRKDMQSEYVSKTLSQEIKLSGKKITDTEQYKHLFNKFTRNLKENSLTPYIDNANFRRGIIDFGTQTFNAYDEKLKKEIKMLITNLKCKFGYTQEGAKHICVYVLDKDLVRKY